MRWEELRRFALLDEGLYAQLKPGGCIAHSSSDVMRERLDAAIAPALWV